MTSWSRAVIGFIFVVPLWSLHPGLAQTRPAGQRPAGQIYEHFRTWATQQPSRGRDSDLLARYLAVLAAEGLSAAEIAPRPRVITEQGQQVEIERWNRILRSPMPTFSTRPNAFLIEMTKHITPGKALAVD